MELPSKIPRQRAEILKVIGPKKTARLSNKDLLAKLPPEYTHHLAKVTSNMRSMCLLDSEKKGVEAAYFLTDVGRDILKNLDKIRQVETYEVKPYKKRKSSGPAPSPLQINISPTANTLADQISLLISENADYRKLMLQLYTTIGNALGLKGKTHNVDSSTTPD